LTQDGPQKEALLHNPEIIISEQNQVSSGIGIYSFIYFILFYKYLFIYLILVYVHL